MRLVTAIALVSVLAAACGEKEDDEKKTEETPAGTSTVAGVQSNPPSASPAAKNGKKVLLVIASDGFYFKEYSDPRVELEAAGYTVEVASAAATPAVPHAGTGQTGSGLVTPDKLITAADMKDYAAVVFPGGWGASMYQFAFDGTLDHAQWARKADAATAANALINAALDAGKPVVGICHGVSVLAYARRDGKSVLDGKKAVGAETGAPGHTVGGRHYADNERQSRVHAELNGAILTAPNAVGDPSTDADDVAIDGLIVTAQNQNSAAAAGKALVELLKTTP